jgi:hypothetical protein
MSNVTLLKRPVDVEHYCPGFKIFHVITSTGRHIRVEADNSDHARYVAKLTLAYPEGFDGPEDTTVPADSVYWSATEVGPNPLAQLWHKLAA